MNSVCRIQSSNKFKLLKDPDQDRNLKENLKKFTSTNTHDNGNSSNRDTETIASLQEQARRYYAAFPALSSFEIRKKELNGKSKKAERANELKLNNWDGRRIIENIKQKDEPFEQTPQPTSPKTTVLQESSDALISTEHSDLDVSPVFLLKNEESDAETFKIEMPKNHNNQSSVNEDSNTLKLLVSKVNNVAAIWNDEAPVQNKSSIWSFDSSFSSPSVDETSANSSPSQYDLFRKIWLSSHKHTKENKFSEFSQRIWEPLKSEKSENNNFNESFWHFNPNFNAIGDCQYVNNTTLANHQVDSLFVEIMNQKENDDFSNPLSKRLFSERQYLCEETGENLLTSPRTHFQPIKQDSFEHDLSEDGSFEADNEVAKLVICSDKCPNNTRPVNCEKEKIIKSRPVSTSLPELSSLMGPFIDAEVDEPIEHSDHFVEHLCLPRELGDYVDKSTSTDEEGENSALHTVYEESEPEFDDLCSLLNEVLKDGLSNESSQLQNDLPKQESLLSSSWQNWNNEQQYFTDTAEQLWKCKTDFSENENFADNEDTSFQKINDEILFDISNSNTSQIEPSSETAYEDYFGNNNYWKNTEEMNENSSKKSESEWMWKEGNEEAPVVHYVKDLEDEWQKEQYYPLQFQLSHRYSS